MKKKIYIVVILLTSGSYFIFKEFNLFPSRSVVNVLSKSLKGLPSDIQDAVSKNESSKEYIPLGIHTKNQKEHEEIGRKLYSVAMTSGFYSKEKIKLLQMAKAHLVLARSMELRK